MEAEGFLEVRSATFSTWPVLRPLVGPVGAAPQYVKIWDTKEKGSDVSLASFMLVDGFKGLYDIAVVVSDDSDLLDPVRLVRSELGSQVGVVCVRTDRTSVFRGRVDFIRSVRRWHFASAQLPQEVTLTSGRRIQCPPEWIGR